MGSLRKLKKKKKKGMKPEKPINEIFKNKRKAVIIGEREAALTDALITRRFKTGPPIYNDNILVNIVFSLSLSYLSYFDFRRDDKLFKKYVEDEPTRLNIEKFIIKYNQRLFDKMFAGRLHSSTEVMYRTKELQVFSYIKGFIKRYKHINSGQTPALSQKVRELVFEKGKNNTERMVEKQETFLKSTKKEDVEKYHLQIEYNKFANEKGSLASIKDAMLYKDIVDFVDCAEDIMKLDNFKKLEKNDIRYIKVLLNKMRKISTYLEKEIYLAERNSTTKNGLIVQAIEMMFQKLSGESINAKTTMEILRKYDETIMSYSYKELLNEVRFLEEKNKNSERNLIYESRNRK